MARPEEKTILVVDDEPDVVIYLKTVLEDAGFRVVTAGNGNEALEQVKKHKPDFISLDLVMPQKSGIRFFYELRHNREWSRIPVVIVTAHAQDENVRKDIDGLFSERTLSGPRTYLEKPIKPKDYVDLVKKELGIEPESEAAGSEADQLRQRVQDLVGSSSPEALRKALAMLSDEKQRS
jgi:two-component system alkaline phosphatase synthesis response regulator PhoP